MSALSLRDERLLRVLDAAAEELDLPVTARQVAALARVASRRLAEADQARPPVAPVTFRGPEPHAPAVAPRSAPGGPQGPKTPARPSGANSARFSTPRSPK
jgi:hypothetical protein